MALKKNSKEIEEIYAGKVAKKYNFSLPPFFATWKKKAFKDSSLKKGDSVLVFCCGTGLDFPHILKKIGKEGEIVGVDFSSEMLRKAKEKIEKENWGNVELVEADITKFEDKLDKKFDAGVCTLGMSIIP
ncbi:MAG: methyltransferase domain-containing protein, partial [Cyclobacteriaceae bacterium]|nr:methyltransferase domain-containing protein [Cyclobacteriaceae bacterium]